ncbi:MAG: phenylalanine--tRNA ligase subunit alpha, partial [Caldiserica bacterium]|nr:phenylalanine--tRNA ligase subunit alpha [Caldisericota bacterium]
MKEIEEIKKEFEEKIKTKSIEELKKVETHFLGRKGKVVDLFKTLKNATEENRKNIGQQINDLKSYVEETISKRLKELEE